jgi:hypothetical protein
MLTVPAMRGAPPHFEAARTCSIAVATARTTGAAIVNAQADSTQRTNAFYDIGECGLCLTSHRLTRYQRFSTFIELRRVAVKSSLPWDHRGFGTWTWIQPKYHATHWSTGSPGDHTSGMARGGSNL